VPHLTWSVAKTPKKYFSVRVFIGATGLSSGVCCGWFCRRGADMRAVAAGPLWLPIYVAELPVGALVPAWTASPGSWTPAGPTSTAAAFQGQWQNVRPPYPKGGHYRDRSHAVAPSTSVCSPESFVGPQLFDCVRLRRDPVFGRKNTI